MYLNYYFYQTNAGSAGSGVYQYYIPTGYSLNATDVAYSITTGNGPIGTRVGTANYVSLGANNGGGGVYITNQASTSGFMLWIEYGPVWAPQQSSSYHYGGANLVIRFDAMIPIN